MRRQSLPCLLLVLAATSAAATGPDPLDTGQVDLSSVPRPPVGPPPVPDDPEEAPSEMQEWGQRTTEGLTFSTQDLDATKTREDTDASGNETPQDPVGGEEDPAPPPTEGPPASEEIELPPRPAQAFDAPAQAAPEPERPEAPRLEPAASGPALDPAPPAADDGPQGRGWRSLAFLATLSTGALLVGLWCWALGLPLFSRRPGRSLEHEGRQRIHAAMQAEPGITLSDLARRLGLRPSHVEYHLRVLARDGHAFKVRSRGFARFFADAAAARRLEKEAEDLRCPRAQDILRLVQEGFTTTRALAAATGLSPEAVRYHVRRLARANLVAKAGPRGGLGPVPAARA